MAEALKTFFSTALVRRLAKDLRGVEPTFPSERFIKQACNGLEKLELLERARHISRTLGAHLPKVYPQAIDILLRSLGPEQVGDELVGVGMAPFFYLPHIIFVAERGLEVKDFDRSMQAQYELTKRFSAEFSIRPYIAQDPERTFGYLRKWSTDSNPHVRRLVSEGTRLRLPWAMRVAWLDNNPKQVLALLEGLKDDPASMVRRSVANNLNDLGKLYPELLTQTCAAWIRSALPEQKAQRRALIEHALRSAIKRGEVKALRLLGYGKPAAVAMDEIRFDPPQVRIGGQVRCSLKLRSTARKKQELLLDLVVHFVKAHGKTSPKVFKLKRVSLAPKQSIVLQASISLAVHTTRKPHPGAHRVEIAINGKRRKLGVFDVRGG